jgi:5,10-methylene-tetrahydrofolate dehydrogenase/methenyl tetrahydrofolate cyclohydrolase
MIKLMGIVTGKQKVNEVKDTTEIIKKIAKLTDRNDHTGAVIELATFLNNTRAIKLLQAIESIHKIEGSMPTEISKYRSSISKDLQANFKSKYGADAAKELNRAF